MKEYGEHMSRIRDAITLLRAKMYALITDEQISARIAKDDDVFRTMLRLHSMKQFRENLDKHISNVENSIDKES